MNLIRLGNGNGNGMSSCCSGLGQDSAIAKLVADQLVPALTPALKDIVAKAAEAAEPTIRTVVREEVMPKAGLYLLLGFAAAGLVGAITASLITRGRRA